MDKKELYAYIDENKEIFEKLSDEIWEYAEISLKEHKSAAAYIKLLEELGFRVETGLAGVETAFSGTFGACKSSADTGSVSTPTRTHKISSFLILALKSPVKFPSAIGKAELKLSA